MTKTIQETFLEIDWGDEDQARQARDARSAELEQEGYVCSSKNLYTVFGYRVYLLEAARPEPADDPTPKFRDRSIRPRRSNPLPPFEAR